MRHPAGGVDRAFGSSSRREPEDPYRVLAGVLADQVAALPDAQTSLGGRRGTLGSRRRFDRPDRSRQAPTPRPPRQPSAPDRIDAVVTLLADAGFDPEPVASGDDAINLRSCPFLPIERRHLAVVCGIHLGFIRGALRELGSTRDATSIEPLVRPDLCVARLGRMPDA